MWSVVLTSPLLLRATKVKVWSKGAITIPESDVRDSESVEGKGGTDSIDVPNVPFMLISICNEAPNVRAIGF